MKRYIGALALAALVGLAAAPATAQNISARPTYGTASLRSGFTPDPHDVTLNAGGPVAAGALGPGCGGHIAAAPDFTLRYRAGALPLFISATSESDTTLVVNAPDGSWHCDDDSAGSLNPVVGFEAPANGRYRIWVGAFAAGGATPEAVLHISEITAAPAAVQNGPNPALDPAYGAVDLASGFQPDPHTMKIQAGGSFDAAALGVPGCVGFVAHAPDYRVNWTAGSGALPLVFSSLSDADTTLVINDAQGNWVCDDDSGNNGLNPSITFAAPASGQYDIWVGTFTAGALQESTLNVSELYSQ